MKFVDNVIFQVNVNRTEPKDITIHRVHSLEACIISDNIHFHLLKFIWCNLIISHRHRCRL